MSTSKRLYIICLVMVLSVFAQNSIAQVQVQVVRSADKVIIAGKQYYIHQTKKSETLYSISKAYGVTVEVITFENPESLAGLKEGQVLKIPVIDIKKPQQEARDESRFIYHELHRGETIYSLSKKYNVDQSSIVAANPGIDIYDLPINSIVAIPRDKFRVELETFSQKDENFLYHKVAKGETLSSISRLYKIPLKELKSANRMLLFPRIDDIVKVPIVKRVEAGTQEQNIDSLRQLFVIPEVELEYVTPEITEIAKLKGEIDVALLLPFYLKENSIRSYIDSTQLDAKGKKIYKTVNRPETWVHEAGVVFLEFYQGMLLAVKDLKAKGLNVNLFVYDTGIDNQILSDLIRNGSLDNMDLIIGPVFSNSIELLAPWANNRDIPMIVPFPTRNAPYLEGNPNVFKIQPSVDASYATLARAAGSFTDANMVLIYSDGTAGRPISEPLKRRVISELSTFTLYENINIKEVAYQSNTAYSNDSIRRIEQSLIAGKENLIIIATEDPPVMSSVLARLHTLSRRYDIKVIGMPALRWVDNLEPKYYYDLEVIVGTHNWIDYSREEVKVFLKSYRETFGTEPTDERSYAFQGYDISYFFISGVALSGRRFHKRIEDHHPLLLTSDYRFTRYNQDSGYENINLYLLQFKKNTTISLFEPKKMADIGAAK